MRLLDYRLIIFAAAALMSGLTETVVLDATQGAIVLLMMLLGILLSMHNYLDQLVQSNDDLSNAVKNKSDAESEHNNTK